MKTTLFLVPALLASPLVAAQLPDEVNFDFQKRLFVCHRTDRLDPSLKPTADEFAFRAGTGAIALPVTADDVLRHAAADFADYLKTSMKLDNAGGVALAIDPGLPAASSRIEVGADGVRITASDSRAAAQALYHLEDLMNLRRAPFLKKGTETRRARFSPRMVHTGYGSGDVFPDEYLDLVAHYGFDSVLIYIKSEPSAKVSDLIDRAAVRGLGVYLYCAQRCPSHPDEPDAAANYERRYGQVAGAYKKAKGMIFVGESCPFRSKDPRVCPPGVPREEREKKYGGKVPATCFPCRDYPDWLAGVKKAVHAHAPKMEIVFWTYNWGGQPYDARMELIDKLNVADTTLLATFEMCGKHKKRNGMESPAADYTLAFEGPGFYFSSEAERAKKRGLRLFAMTNTGGRTWDFGGIPYLPCPYQWKRRWDKLAKAHDDWGLSGLMESHHYGWSPSFISELCKEAYVEGGIPFDEHIRKIAARDFGEANVDAVLAVWRDWSDAIRDYMPSGGNQYGIFRIGPSYPYNFGGPHIDRKLCFCHPNYVEKIRGWYMFDDTIKPELELLTSARDKFVSGAATLARLAAALPEDRAEPALRLANLGGYLGCYLTTGVNVKRGAIAWYAGDMKQVREIAREEYANATAAIPYARRDSHLGWEPVMRYCGDETMIRWKLALMDKAYGENAVSPLDELLPAPQRIERDDAHTAAADTPVTFKKGAVAGAPARTADQAYCLEIRRDGIVITASGKAGELYAKTTLEQLKKLCENYGFRLPCCTITDWPRFPYRGLMHDVGRNYQTVQDLKDCLDWMARYKMNLFHFHLTEYYGWRLESKKYPELQSDRAFARHKGRYYTQKEFVEIVDYARERGITVMPEFDVPGHSDAFRRAFNIEKMDTPGVDQKICDLIDELCALLPPEKLPIIHLGTDEVRKCTVPPEWIVRWGERVVDNGRILVGWVPGRQMDIGRGTVWQETWGSTAETAGDVTDPCHHPYFDSTNLYYPNHYDPLELVGAAAYKQPCPWGPEEKKLGPMLSVWHNDAIEECSDMSRTIPYYMLIAAYSDSYWRGREKDNPDLYGRLPLPTDPRAGVMRDLERRLAAHRDRMTADLKHGFPFARQTQLRWRLTDAETGKVVAQDLAQAWVQPYHKQFKENSFLPKNEGKAILETWIKSPRTQAVGVWIDCTSFARSWGRHADGPVPQPGEWNRHGATVEVNGKLVRAPAWKNAGIKDRAITHETPIADECWWTREPMKISLNEGWNHVKLTLPKTNSKKGKWVATFLPVGGTTDRPRDLLDLEYSSEPR